MEESVQIMTDVSNPSLNQNPLPSRMIRGKVQRKVRTALSRQTKLLCDIDVALSSDGAVFSQILDVGIRPRGRPIGATVMRSS